MWKWIAHFSVLLNLSTPKRKLGVFDKLSTVASFRGVVVAIPGSLTCGRLVPATMLAHNVVRTGKVRGMRGESSFIPSVRGRYKITRIFDFHNANLP